MSIDLEWTKLDSSLSNYLVEVLNKQLGNAERPSFIGPIEVTSLDFGTNPPDVELVDLRDIYRDFLDDEDDDDDDSGRGPVKVTEGPDDDDGFEWVSRRAAGRAEDTAAPAYGRHLPQHLHYGFSGSSTPGGSMDPWASNGLRQPGTPIADLGGGGRHPWDNGGAGAGLPMFRSPTPSTPFTPGLMHRTPPSGGYSSGRAGSFDSAATDALPAKQLAEQLLRPLQSVLGSMAADTAAVPSSQDDQQNAAAPHPNLQLHFQINWQSNLRITITTSLLINYPSPMFMSLPIKLSITGIVFSGEIAVAYEGERRRVHLCILDDLDPYGPAGDRPKREEPPLVPTSGLETASLSLSSELDDDVGVPLRPAKPLPIGERLLPSIIIESEIGQADKHVLKNVTRIERFIQDVIRKTVEEELVFPNFHTLVMGEQ